MRKSALTLSVLLPCLALVLLSREPQADARMKNAFRKPDQNGWIYVHLEGAPAAIGFQHGSLLAPEIDDTVKAISLELTHDHEKPWEFFRNVAKDVLWPHVEREYREELQGIADGLAARGVKRDLWDVVALNAWLELPYYMKWYKSRQGDKSPTPLPERCSAFVATGSYTRDRKPVMAHNAWTSYTSGERWNVVFDLRPAAGHHIIMDGMPGMIHSGDDFGINGAGIMITETTISGFTGWDSNGIPEFMRARKAMQYSASIDDFDRIMRAGNNGGYANTWLVADNRTGEIARLELGLKNVNLKRTRDGYFVGSNYPIDEKLAREETDFDLKDLSLSANARRVRWEQLMAEHKGRIDVAAAQRFMTDHYDSFDKKEQANERTLCGHIEASPRGVKGWVGPYGIAGAVQSKAADSAMAARLSFTAALGHACGANFNAGEHLKQHPEYAWMQPALKDMKAQPWTTFRAK